MLLSSSDRLHQIAAWPTYLTCQRAYSTFARAKFRWLGIALNSLPTAKERALVEKVKFCTVWSIQRGETCCRRRI